MERPYRFFGEFRLFDLAMDYRAIIFSEPASFGLLRFTPQSFVEHPVHLIYFVLPVVRF